MRRFLPIWICLLMVLACNIPIQTRFSAVPTPTIPETLPVMPTTSPSLFVSPTVFEPPATETLPVPSLTPLPEYQPVFEPDACAFNVPPGTIPECGYLVVPENRSLADSRKLRLHVAIFRSRSANPSADPVIHLAGGPGSSSLEVAGYLFSYGMGAVLDERDLILFDQRGTGYSQPRLDCPERTALNTALLAGGMTWEEKESAIVDAFHRCRERLVAEGNDLTAYNSAQSAADVNDLRRALGFDQVNLYGVSYGTRLALTVMRDYPQGVRSAVLDSVYPPQVNLYTSLASNAERAFNVLFERCASDPSCSANYPDLKRVFYELVDQLNASPVNVSLWVGGRQYAVSLDGGLLIDVLLVGLYNPAVAARMPQMIYDVRRGEYGILQQRLALYFDDASALGMNMAVQCNEEIPFNVAEDAFAAAQGVQPQIGDFFPNNVRPLFTACRKWKPDAPDARENQAVRADVPALILAGDFDPITPPEWGRMAAETLSQASFFEIAGNGHWVTRSSDCALQMALDFWREPTAPVNNRCP